MRQTLGTFFTLLTITAVFACLAGCPADPYDPQTWIEKLDEPHEAQMALTKLKQLKDPVAIKPLGELWRKHSKPSKVLRIIVQLAKQQEFCPGGVTKEDRLVCPGDVKKQEGPFWTDAIPILQESVEEFDIGDRRSIDDASFAAENLGEAKDPESVAVLISAATKKMPKLSPGQRVRIAAIRALGNYPKNGRAVDTLIKVLSADPKEQSIKLNAAAANALALTGSDKAIQPLLAALYEISPIYKQVRGALTNLGKPAVDEFVKIFQGKHEEMNKLAKKHKFAEDCDKAQGPESNCKAPGNLRFKAASILGDMRAASAVKMLSKALSEKPNTAFFDPKSGAPGPPDHNAILDALRIIGSAKAAPAVLAYAKSKDTLEIIRPLSLDVYSMLATDKKGLEFLGKTVKDDNAEEEVRKAAALAYARMVTKKSEYGPLDYMIDRYEKEAKKYDAKAKKAKEKRDKDYAEATAEGYRGFVVLFEEHKTRALVGIKCKSDPKCYAKLVGMKNSALFKELGIKLPEKASKAMKKNRGIAARERALLEIGKMGKKAQPVADMLLDKVDSTDRIVRQGILLALHRVMDKPCKKCVERLDEVINKQKDQTTLDALVDDTRIVRNYFRWASDKD